jgi:hypothetical protein
MTSISGVAGAGNVGIPVAQAWIGISGVAGAGHAGIPVAQTWIGISGVTGAGNVGIPFIAQAWIAYSDPLLVSIDQSIAGQNWIDNRSIWHDLSEITFGTGDIDGAQWYQDSGPLGVAASVLEPRAFCLKGQASFMFTGATLIVRLNIAFSYFTGAVVTIDGVAPSTLDLLTSIDTLSCDSATYQLDSDGYIDVVVADGLIDTLHTCVITVDSPNPAQFWGMSGFKVGVFTSQVIPRDDGWLVPPSFTLTQNKVTITITNRGVATVVVPTFSFPSGLVDGSNAALTTLSGDSLSPSQTLSQVVLPVFAGTELSGEFTYSFTLSAQYFNPDGDITNTTTFTLIVANPALNIVGTWYQDTSTPGSLLRVFTSTFGSYLEFTFVGDALAITVQQEASWGVIGIYDANDDLLNTVTCDVDTGGLLATISLTGFGAGSHTVFLKKTVDDGAFIVFISAAWAVTSNYTAISETVVMNYTANQPVAMPVLNAAVGAYDMTFDAPIPDTTDYSGTPVRENTDLAYTEVLTRFPTFAVCYKTGFVDVLGQYDILIVDPLAAHAADVLTWQANGIKVFGYISSGEEVGFYANRYDFTSALAPNAGDGPGGYATYFMYTQNPVSGPPDEDGVFASYYTNPDPSFGWPDRIANYYAPQVLGGPVTVVDEVVTTKSATITAGSVIVFDTAQSPIDVDDTITLTTMDGATTYVTYSDYTFDAKTGAVVLSTNISPAVTIGQQLKISYTRKGHTMDGVFFDTVDTPDVYSGNNPPFPFVAGYAGLFADMINNFKTANPDALLISNRGFTILPQIIQSCKGVMFETWLTTATDPSSPTTTAYEIITDPDTMAFNDSVNAMLRELRLIQDFDVYSLNYCDADSSGDALRAYCRANDAERGYLSWQSTIALDTPAANDTQTTPGLPITSNAFTRYKTKGV